MLCAICGDSNIKMVAQNLFTGTYFGPQPYRSRRQHWWGPMDPHSKLWPVSNLPVLLKVVERAVVQQFNNHMNKNGLLPRYQWAFRRHHSSETAKLRVMSDALKCDTTRSAWHVSSFRLCRPWFFASAAGETLRSTRARS